MICVSRAGVWVGESQTEPGLRGTVVVPNGLGYARVEGFHISVVVAVEDNLLLHYGMCRSGHS